MVVGAAVVGGTVVGGGEALGPRVVTGDPGAGVGGAPVMVGPAAPVPAPEPGAGVAAVTAGAPAASVAGPREPTPGPVLAAVVRGVAVEAGPASARRSWGRAVVALRWETAAPPRTSSPAAAELDNRRAGRRCTPAVSVPPVPVRSKERPPEPQDLDKNAPVRLEPSCVSCLAMDASPVFQLRRERDGDVVRLWLAGDFDQSQRDTVIDALDQGETPAEIVIEMSQVGFMGSSGLSALIHACRLLQPAGGQVVLLDPASPVVRLLDTCGLTHLFTIQIT